MDVATLALLVAALVLVVVGLWAVATYNGLARLNGLVGEAWRQVEVELHRRHDLVPGLVESARPAGGHDDAVLAEVLAARAEASAPQDGPAAQASRENVLTAALGHLLSAADDAPAVRASEDFRARQAELTGTEDRIAAGRRYYNANVRQLNTRLGTFPAGVVGRLAGIGPAEYFEANDPVVRAAPAVTFSDPDTAVEDPPRPAP